MSEHHPSCRESDKDLVWHCVQCGLNESAGDLEQQLADERENARGNAADMIKAGKTLEAQLAAEREISATLGQQVHELRIALGQADDWNKITSIEINNIRSLNKEIEEDKLKTELACEQWIRQCEELQQQLAAEREKVRKLRCEVAAWKEPK